jgi:hypothetical protein
MLQNKLFSFSYKTQKCLRLVRMCLSIPHSHRWYAPLRLQHKTGLSSQMILININLFPNNILVGYANVRIWSISSAHTILCSEGELLKPILLRHRRCARYTANIIMWGSENVLLYRIVFLVPFS